MSARIGLQTFKLFVLVLLASVALQFVQTFLPFKICNRSRHKYRCMLSLFHLSISDTVRTLDHFFGSNAKQSYSPEDIIKILKPPSTELEKETNKSCDTCPSNANDRALDDDIIQVMWSKQSSLSDDDDDDEVVVVDDDDDDSDDEYDVDLPKDKSIIENDADRNIAVNLIPVNASLVDIFLHKFLLHNVALDSARIQSCFERGKRE